MKIYDIDNLRKKDQEFDLTTRTFNYTSVEGSEFGIYKVQKGEEMRIDLVCNSIYGNLNNIDIILNINNISNPLNIKEGSELIYPLNEFDIFRYKEEVDEETTKILADLTRTGKKDPDRKKYQDQNYSLPPTILERPLEQVTTKGGILEVGNNLFRI